MLVPTMTPEEIFAEISKDEDWIREQVEVCARSMFKQKGQN